VRVVAAVATRSAAQLVRIPSHLHHFADIVGIVGLADALWHLNSDFWLHVFHLERGFFASSRTPHQLRAHVLLELRKVALAHGCPRLIHTRAPAHELSDFALVVQPLDLLERLVDPAAAKDAAYDDEDRRSEEQPDDRLVLVIKVAQVVIEGLL